MSKSKLFVQQPFVGKMKERKESVFMQASTRALRRGNFNTHKTMILQVIEQFKLVGGTFNNIGIRMGGGKLIAISGKGIYHDASVFQK